MKKYSLETFKERKKRKKVFNLTIVTLIAVVILIIASLYIANREFRTFVDTYLLRKEISEENANTLVIDTENLSLIYAYNKNLVIYNDGNINFYNQIGKESGKIEMTLSKPIADTKGKYLVLGDYGSQKICLIKSNNLVWQKDLEGKISKVSVNENGYVAVTVTGTTYESIVMLYNPKGDLLFSNYLSVHVMETDISENNKYLAIAEVDNSGITPTTKIEIISIDTAVKNTGNATVNTYQSEASEMLTGLEYQHKNKLLCSFDNYIIKMTESTSEKIYETTDLTAYVDVRMDNHFIKVDKESSSVFKSDYRLKIQKTEGKEKNYIIEGSIKSVKTTDKTIALNLGKEVQFIGTNGWLKKRYKSNQEVTRVILSDEIGVMIYSDKIDIINL